MTLANKKGWIDISVPLFSGMVIWPGDPSVRIERVFDLDHGDECTVSAISMGSHTGTHIDAPLHFIKGAKCMDEMPFDATIGLSRIIEIFDKGSIKAEELINHGIRPGERILFKTRNSDRLWNSNRFAEDFVYIEHAAADFLVNRKVRTVGVDYLSVGGFDQDGAKTHHILLEAGIWIIEGLDLSRVEHGRYKLICLPVKILKSDAAPARAIVKRVK